MERGPTLRRALLLWGQVGPYKTLKQGDMGRQSSKQAGLNIKVAFTANAGVLARTGSAQGRGDMEMRKQLGLHTTIKQGEGKAASGEAPITVTAGGSLFCSDSNFQIV